jgi:MoaA/NifB/PqqE/SkfB family radical SAM enzyme
MARLMRSATALVVCLTLLFPPVPAWGEFHSSSRPPRPSEAALTFDMQAVTQPLFSTLHPFFDFSKIYLVECYLRLLPLIAYAPSRPMLGTGLAMAMFPPTRLDIMKRSFKQIDEERTSKPGLLWDIVRNFIAGYFKPAVFHEDLEQKLEMEEMNRQFFTWLSDTAKQEPSLMVPMALLQIQLKSLPNIAGGYIRDTRDDFEVLKNANAHEELLSVVKNSFDFIDIASAYDALRELPKRDPYESLYFQNKISAFLPTESREGSVLTPLSKPIEMVPYALPLLARLNVRNRSAFVYDMDVIRPLQGRFKLPNVHHAMTALRLLNFEDVQKKDVQSLLLAMAQNNDLLIASGGETVSPLESAGDFDLYVTINMLAILQLMVHSSATHGLLEPDQIPILQREITRRHWRASDYGLARSPRLTRMAGVLGEMMYSQLTDPDIQKTRKGVPTFDHAMKTFMGFLFEMVVQEALGMYRKGPVIHPAVYHQGVLLQASDAGSQFEHPEEAARVQFTALVHALNLQEKREYSWSRIYRFANWFLRAKNESLSLLASEILLNFGRSGKSELTAHEADYITQHTRHRTEDTRKKRWQVFISELLRQSKLTEDQKSVFPSLHRPWDRRSPDEMFDEIVERFIPVLFSESHLKGKFNKLRVFVDRIDDLVKWIRNEPLDNPYFLSQLEIDPTEYCNESCIMCRFEEDKTGTLRGLRDVPPLGTEAKLTGAQMVHILDEAVDIAPHMDGRVSGQIGEPLTNHDTLMLLQELNEKKVPYVVITNGLLPERAWNRFLNVLYAPNSTMGALSISVNSGTNATYIKVMRPRPAPFFGDRPRTYVMENVKRAVERRSQSGHSSNIFVTAVIQEENYSEMELLVAEGKAAGVSGVQFKTQGADPRQKMAPKHIRDLYAQKPVFDRYADDYFKVVFIDEQEAALYKNEGRPPEAVQAVRLPLYKDGKPVDEGPEFISMVPKTIRFCLAQVVAPAIAADGVVHACCMNFKTEGVRRTLPPLGKIGEMPLKEMLLERLRRIKSLDPQQFCLNCSPSDEFVNELINRLMALLGYPDELNDVVRRIKDRRQLEHDKESAIASDSEMHSFYGIAIATIIGALASGTHLNGASISGLTGGSSWAIWLMSAAGFALYAWDTSPKRARWTNGWQRLQTAVQSAA